MPLKFWRAGMSAGGRGWIPPYGRRGAAGGPGAGSSAGYVVAVTGEVDYVTDGERVLSVAGQSADDPVVGTGCALVAVAASAAPGRPAGKRGRRLR